MITESDLVGLIPGVGPKAMAQLSEIGIVSIADLLKWYPRTYLFASAMPVPISAEGMGQVQAIWITITKSEVKRGKARRIPYLEVVGEDENGVLISARWFGQAYRKEQMS